MVVLLLVISQERNQWGSLCCTPNSFSPHHHHLTTCTMKPKRMKTLSLISFSFFLLFCDILVLCLVSSIHIVLVNRITYIHAVIPDSIYALTPALYNGKLWHIPHKWRQLKQIVAMGFLPLVGCWCGELELRTFFSKSLENKENERNPWHKYSFSSFIFKHCTSGFKVYASK